MTHQVIYTTPIWNISNAHMIINALTANTTVRWNKMLNEICRLHRKLDFDHKIKVTMTRTGYESDIYKNDILKIINGNILKVVRPSGEIVLINSRYIVTAYTTKRDLW